MHQYQAQIEEILQANPAVDETVTLSGVSAFQANQGGGLAILRDPSPRPPIGAAAGQPTGPAVMKTPAPPTFLQPNPALPLSTGATSQTQGQFAYALSGSNPSELYDLAGRFLQKMYEFPGFLFVNSDLFDHTPSLQVDVLRDQAKLYGISEARILSLLRSAYSQNYAYLIKKPNNQYQVIVEDQDNDREDPQNLNLLYIKSDDGQRMVPLGAVTAARMTLGPQAVNHINQLASVSRFFTLTPGYAIGQATTFVERAAKQMLPGDVRGTFQGQALVFRETVAS